MDLGGFGRPVLPLSALHGELLDPLSFGQHFSVSPGVDVCGRDVLKRLVVSLVVVVGNEVSDGLLELPRELWALVREVTGQLPGRELRAFQGPVNHLLADQTANQPRPNSPFSRPESWQCYQRHR